MLSALPLLPIRIIVTRYHGPTDVRGSRISARVPSGERVTVPYDHAASDAHAIAAMQLCIKLGWPNPTHVGNVGYDRAFVVPFGERGPHGEPIPYSRVDE